MAIPLVKDIHLPETLRIIRCGLRHSGPISDDLYRQLADWCALKQDYVDRYGLADPFEGNVGAIISAHNSGEKDAYSRPVVAVHSSTGGYEDVMLEENETLWDAIEVAQRLGINNVE